MEFLDKLQTWLDRMMQKGVLVYFSHVIFVEREKQPDLQTGKGGVYKNTYMKKQKKRGKGKEEVS